MFPAFAKGLTIYEVNLRQYSVSGSIQDFLKSLPRLKAMGVGILWLMPVHPVGQKNRKGSLGSYYSVRDYYAVDPSFGSLDDFKLLVQVVHEEGMYLIMDWVANHTSWDNTLTLSHPDYYRKDKKGSFVPPFADWEDVIKLDYNNPDVWRYMEQAMQYWIDETGIDGFRCDMANLVPLQFWKQAIQTLRKSKTLFMLAEADDRGLLEVGFDAIYNWNVFHIFNRFITSGNNATLLDQVIEDNFTQFPSDYSQLLFTSNHDENSWNGSAIERLGAALEATTAMTFTLPGIPLIYSGQEAGELKRLSFFDKDLISWKKDKMTTLYSHLTRLRMNNPALWSKPYGGTFKRIPNTLNQHVFSFIREKNGNKVLVMANLSWVSASFVLSGYLAEGEYVNALNGKKVFVVPGAHWTLGPWEYYILVK